MIDELVNEFLGNQEVSDDYVNGIIRKVEDVIDYSNLSERYLCKTIAKPYPESFNKLQNNVSKIINDNYGSVVVRPKSFKYGGYITASLMYKYILNSLKDDEDLKRFMNKDTFGDVGLKLEYSLDVLFKDIYEADFVFWDNFNLVNTHYEVDKLYEIFSRRYMHLKGNILYLCGKNKAELTNNFDENLKDMLDLTEFYDLSKAELFIS